MSRRSAASGFKVADSFVAGFLRRILRVTLEVGTKLALCRHQVTGEVANEAKGLLCVSQQKVVRELEVLDGD